MSAGAGRGRVHLIVLDSLQQSGTVNRRRTDPAAIDTQPLLPALVDERFDRGDMLTDLQYADLRRGATPLAPNG